MSNYNNISERRRYPRYEINIGAILAFDETIPFAPGEQITLKCSVLDFCTHGLFLEIKKSLMDFSHLLHKKGKVLFPLITDQGRKYAQVEAEVVRISPQGVGVSFENISESVFKALLRKAKKKAGPPDASINPSQIEIPADKEQFKTSLKELLGIKLPVLMNAFFKRVRNDLEEAARQTLHFRDEAVFLDAISDLRFFQSAIEKDFCWSLCNEMDFVRKSGSETAADNNDISLLSLVAKDEFEEWLTQSSCTKKITAHFNEQINQIVLKLGHVTGIPGNDLNNPLDPDNLYRHFRESIGKIEAIGPIKPTLYKAFEAVLVQELPEIYLSFENLLVRYGAPECIVEEPGPLKKKVISKAGESDVSMHRTASGIRPPEQHPGPAGQANGRRSRVLEYPEFQTDSRSPWIRRIQPLAQTAGRLLDIIYQRDTQAAPSSEAESVDKEAPGYAVYSSDEIASAIAQLHSRYLAEHPIRHPAANIQKELPELLAASSNGSKQLSAADKNRLELYGQFFDTLINELTWAPHVRAYLESIYLPLMAQALKDSDFLDSEIHPARNVVNQLFSLESAVEAGRNVRNHNVREILDQLFNRIVREGIWHPEIFSYVNEELKEMTRTLAKSKELNIRRVVEACEGRHKLETARRLVQDEIDRRIAGKWIPSVVKSLLDAGWQHLLVITELNGQGKADNRQRYLETLDRLLDWFNQRELSDQEKSVSIRRELSLIDAQLGSVCTNAFLHGRVMDELQACLLGAGSPPERKVPDKVFVEPAKQETVTAAGIAENRWTRLVRRLRVGDWISFPRETGRVDPLKLVWSGDGGFEHYVFVNREGQKKLELGRDELASLFRAGAAAKTDNLDEPLMERAADKVLQKMYEKLVFNSSHDQVTQLINKREFLKRLKLELSSIDESRHMLCYMEILDFRMISNICGSAAGDELLRNIAGLVKSQLDQEILFARLGDKIFGILIKHCSEHEGCDIAQKLREIINSTHFEWEDKSFPIGISIGLVPFYEQGYNAEELLQLADSASIAAKRSGNNRIRLFKEDDTGIKAQIDLHEWAGRIDRIFAENRLFVRCQRISPIEPEKNRHSHYEILLGLTDNSGKMIPPGDFLPAVEHCRRMPEIDRWVTDTVFSWIEKNRDYFDAIGGFAINLSGQSLNSDEFLSQLLLRLSSCTVPLDKITFEVTETVASDNLIFTESFISRIKQFGCKFSLDDFGTGYSSYSYLKSLDVDYLKIDGSFVKEIAGSPTDVAMVKSMNEIAHSLGLKTIAEYVENDEILAVLKEIGVDYGQGWCIHKPVLLTELAT